MRRLTPEEEERKRAIFESMSPKWREKILKRGYDKWDPFAPPKDPIDLRRDLTGNTAASLVKRFLDTKEARSCSPAFVQGVWEICQGLMTSSDRYRGMYEFCCWYRDLLQRHRGVEEEGRS
jgi:hypothetical protein